MRLQRMRSARLNQPNQVTLKDAFPQDNLIESKIIVYFATKKIQRKI